MKKNLCWALLTAALMFATAGAQERAAFKLSHQGILSDAKGAPVADGKYAITFKLYDIASGGAPIWSEERTVSVSKGIFNLLLGEVKTLNLPFDKPYWLGVTIGSGAELLPRMELTASAYSLHAKTIADSAISTSKIQDGAITLNKIAPQGGAPGQVLTVTPEGRVAWQSVAVADKVARAQQSIDAGANAADLVLPYIGSVTTGVTAFDVTNNGAGGAIIGTSFSTAASVVGVRGIIGSTTPGGFSAGVRGINNGTGVNGIGVYGSQAGSGWGVYGTAPNGIGVNGIHTGTAGQNPGVRGETASNDGSAVGVLGLVSSTSSGALSAGVRGINNGVGSSGGNEFPIRAGVWGTADAGTSYGVYGTSLNGTGVSGQGELGVEGWSQTGTGVRGTHNATSGTAPGVWGETFSTAANAVGVLGLAASLAPGGFSAGVRGINNGTSGSGIGVYGSHAGAGWGVYGTSVGGRGVYGIAKTGYGVFGRHDSTTGINAGVHGETASTTNASVGVYGIATATGAGTTYGVYGQSNKTSGSGVHGYTSATTGSNNGVYGRSVSTTGRGVYGWASNTTGVNYGVYGQTSSASGYGVYGVCTAAGGRGVYGNASSTTGTNYGVYGRTASASGYAGWFAGRVHVAGTLSKTSGSFKIDHPLDPANKYLYHSFVESPDMMNIYNGNAVLDGAGEAWVEMPAWFNALNRDFRYQLTAIGAPGPNLYIAQEVQGNRFKIAGGQPGSKVSWQVTGVRQDAFAEKYRIPVEEAKPVAERGRFIHPEVFGQPANMSVEAAYEGNMPVATPEQENEN